MADHEAQIKRAVQELVQARGRDPAAAPPFAAASAAGQRVRITATTK